MAKKKTARRLLARNKRFYITYFTVLAAALIGLLFGVSYLKTILGEYEQSQSDVCAREYAKVFLSRDFAAIYPYEDVDYLNGASVEEYADFMTAATDGMEITYRKTVTPGEDTAQYIVLANGKRFGSFTLAVSSGFRTAHGFPLWSLSDMETTSFYRTQAALDAEAAQNPQPQTIRVQCDARSTVSVNGAQLSTDAIVETGITKGIAARLPNGVAEPTYVVYEVSDVTDPRIDVTDRNGRAQPVTLTDGVYVAGDNSRDDELRKMREAWIFETAKVISAYTTNDATINTALQRVENKSAAHKYLTEINRDYIKAHRSYSFENMVSQNYVEYDDDCFSVEVSYNYLVDFYGTVKTYETAYRFYFRRENKLWLLYDFETL